MNKFDLVILAGGKGTRIKKYLNKNSKPMIKFFGYYFIDFILSITSFGISLYSKLKHHVEKISAFPRSSNLLGI